jgi:hypothetical protein
MNFIFSSNFVSLVDIYIYIYFALCQKRPWIPITSFYMLSDNDTKFIKNTLSSI